MVSLWILIVHSKFSHISHRTGDVDRCMKFDRFCLRSRGHARLYLGCKVNFSGFYQIWPDPDKTQKRSVKKTLKG